MLTQAKAEQNTLVTQAVERRFFEFAGKNVTYHIAQKKKYTWTNPEEWVRAHTIAYLVLKCGYPPNRIKTEVTVPRRTPSDKADIVVYSDDKCKTPYLVVENKSDGQSATAKKQGIEQLFGNCNSLRCPFGLYDEFGKSSFYDVQSFAPTERKENLLGSRKVVPNQYGETPEYAFLAGPGDNGIEPATPRTLESKIRRTHSIIWAGGKRDPLTAFDEWSKLLFAKVHDERTTPNGKPLRFQIGTNETTVTVATCIHSLFAEASKNDRTIFPAGIQIDLPDRKIFEVVRTLQGISITDTDTDTIGVAFESFFGAVFRGELGQYFTMRQISRFVVAMLEIAHGDFVIDPTAGSGGFLLEVLLQVWHKLDRDFKGRNELERYKNDFALLRVFGIEIHPILARICKINLLLHHDGHTNIEADKSCLDTSFSRNRLKKISEQFSVAVGNPPFGDKVEEGDEDLLGSNSLESFVVAAGRRSVPSEHVVVERVVDMLEPGGRFGLVLPDGLLNNQGELSNCPQTRRILAVSGKLTAIVSLPDYAFRKSGAQNKTSILFFQKFTTEEKSAFDAVLEESDGDIQLAIEAIDYEIFLAEANFIGYSTTGTPTDQNDLYNGSQGGNLARSQAKTILGEYRKFKKKPKNYTGYSQPDCMAKPMSEIWSAHTSNRLDPKYHLFKEEEDAAVPDGWVRMPIRDVMRRRINEVHPEENPDVEVVVMTLTQTGDIRPRQAGKGNSPPSWMGMYFADMPSEWHEARSGDLVFSGIDLWKGCISVVPDEFDRALVTKEFPIYQITDKRLSADFLSCLLRTRHYQRAFRAITTGHSNRRRTQTEDFESLEICFPVAKKVQADLIKPILRARTQMKKSGGDLRFSLLELSDLIDGRGDETLDEDEGS